MLIRRLEITAVRNLRQVRLSELSRVNILFGSNGAGKTSVLESIHLLSAARSFRTHKLAPLINKDSQSCVVYGEVKIPGSGYQPIGVERSRSKGSPSNIKVSGKPIRSSSVLADSLPLQVISSEAFKLLEGAPLVRRQFMDWGVFHVEHGFHTVWKATQRCLKHRNTLLRHDRMDGQQLAVWTTELARSGQQLDEYRRQYFERFIPIFEDILARLIDLDGLQISYYRGWDKERNLDEVLNQNLQREFEQGHTLVGPHRADLRLRYQSALAAEVLSRGQQKLVVCALRVAQGYLLSEVTGRQCVFLIDDLPSELDVQHRSALCKLLEELQCQVFVTCVNPSDMNKCWPDEKAITMFHVEHGNVSPSPAN
jgi:DNA replication and repair protein RecF